MVELLFKIASILYILCRFNHSTAPLLKNPFNCHFFRVFVLLTPNENSSILQSFDIVTVSDLAVIESEIFAVTWLTDISDCTLVFDQ